MTFASVYEMFDPLTTVRKQRFWDWFSGDALHSKWTERNITGTGSSGITDVADGGAFVKTGTSSGDKTQIDFNNIRQYAHNGSVMIAVSQRVSSSGENFVWMASDTINDPASYYGYADLSSDTYKKLLNQGGGGSTSTDTSTAVDTAMTGIKLEAGSSNNVLSLSGVSAATSTTNLPTLKLMPNWRARTTAAAEMECRSRYFEAYNT